MDDLDVDFNIDSKGFFIRILYDGEHDSGALVAAFTETEPSTLLIAIGMPTCLSTFDSISSESIVSAAELGKRVMQNILLKAI